MKAVGRQLTSAPPAVILGFAGNGLGVARSLAPSGIRCIGIAGSQWHPAHETRTASIVHTASWAAEDVVEALLTLGRQLNAPAPLIITKDLAVLIVSEHREKLRQFYRFHLPSREIVQTLMNKQRFQARAETEGWPVPRTWSFEDERQVTEGVEGLPYPCIVKPRIKNRKFRSQDLPKAFKVSSPDELLAVYGKIAASEPEVVVQEWIEGGDERVAYCLAYYGDEGEPLGLFAGRKLRQWQPRCGGTAIAEPAPAPWQQPLLELSRQIWREVEFRGLGSIEYKMTLDGSKPIITEPTVGRTNYQSEIAVLNGVNIPLICYLDLMGQNVEPHVGAHSGPSTKLIDGVRELRSAAYYYRRGELSLRQWLEDRGGRRRYMLFRLTDPMPFIIHSVRNVFGAFRRVLSRSAKTLRRIMFDSEPSVDRSE